MADRISNLPNPKTIAAAARARRMHLPLQERKRLAGELLRDDPRQSNGVISWAVGVSAPTVRLIRSGLERCGAIDSVPARIDSLGRSFPATHLPNRGRLCAPEVMAMRGVAKACAAVGALRVVELVLLELAGDPTLAAKPFSAIEGEHFGFYAGTRTPAA
jgi:DNA-binding Lrp family transcriptional regulator